MATMLSGTYKSVHIVLCYQSRDRPDPVAEAQFTADALSGELVLIEGAGHYPQTEMPAQTISTILFF
jgi:pimeloyl-ACP methyl ester carboxylesterase